jgi:hypothetical protein
MSTVLSSQSIASAPSRCLEVSADWFCPKVAAVRHPRKTSRLPPYDSRSRHLHRSHDEHPVIRVPAPPLRGQQGGAVDKPRVTCNLFVCLQLATEYDNIGSGCDAKACVRCRSGCRMCVRPSSSLKLTDSPSQSQRARAKQTIRRSLTRSPSDWTRTTKSPRDTRRDLYSGGSWRIQRQTTTGPRRSR